LVDLIPELPPPAEPLLHYLVAGFVLLAAGLAWLTSRRPSQSAINTPEATRRALLYILVYTLCVTCFSRVMAPALMGREQSPWLLALGDVIFVTLGLFVWVMALAESRPWREYGFHVRQPTRVALMLALAAVAAFLVSHREYSLIASGRVRLTADALVFSLLFASVGSALPEELLFRGYLQGSLEGQVNRWARLMLPAVMFALFRAIRFLPGTELPLGDWMTYLLGVALPLGMWWGLMRDLAGGSLWPSLVSHFVLEFGSALAAASPRAQLPTF
jgi:membrane protease YdiL (CAAX protease family)